MSEREVWVVGQGQVTQGDLDYVRAVEEFATQAEAEAALAAGDYADEGHAWSGLTIYRVLVRRGGVYHLPDGTAYYPKDGYGF